MDNPASLHTNISNQLNQMGHKSTPVSVNPDDDSALQNIKDTLGDAAHVVGTAGVALGGEEQATYVRTALGRRFLSLIKERVKRLWK